MKKKVLIVLTILFLLAMICLLFYYNYAKKNLMLLPEGELQSTYTSPNGEKKLNIYLVDGGSLSANAIRGEIETKNKKYNMYYCYRNCDFDVKVEWKNNNILVINEKEIDINKDRIRIE